MQRRQFIVTGAAVASVGLAGCLGGSSTTDSPESVVEAFYTAQSESEQDGLIHSTSPYHPEKDDGQFSGTLVYSAQSVETSVVDGDLGDDDLQSRIQTHLGLGDADYDILSGEEVTIVEADVELPDIFGEGEAAEEWIQPVLTATEDGEWKIVIELTH